MIPALPTLEHLIAINAIKSLKARYFRCMDSKDWSGLESVFAVDAVMDMREEVASLIAVGIPVEFGGMLTGSGHIVESVMAALEHVVSIHHGHMPEIEITGPNTARGIWAMEDTLYLPPEAEHAMFHGFGHYHETYYLADNGWQIKTLRLSRLKRDIVKRKQASA